MAKQQQRIHEAHLIERAIDIWRITGRSPKVEPRRMTVPLCSRCENHVKIVKVDYGQKPKTPSMDRGSPRKPKKNDGRPNKRYEHIGWYCRNCHIFFYPDGSPDFRGIT